MSGSTKSQAPWFFGSSWHQTKSAFGKRESSWVSEIVGKRVKLFDAEEVGVFQPLRVAFGEEVVVDLAGAEDDALDLVVGLELLRRVALLRIVPEDAVEGGAVGEILGPEIAIG
jgi:hypothetical protein